MLSALTSVLELFPCLYFVKCQVFGATGIKCSLGVKWQILIKLTIWNWSDQFQIFQFSTIFVQYKIYMDFKLGEVVFHLGTYFFWVFLLRVVKKIVVERASIQFPAGLPSFLLVPAVTHWGSNRPHCHQRRQNQTSRQLRILRMGDSKAVRWCAHFCNSWKAWSVPWIAK